MRKKLQKAVQKITTCSRITSSNNVQKLFEIVPDCGWNALYFCWWHFHFTTTWFKVCIMKFKSGASLTGSRRRLVLAHGVSLRCLWSSQTIAKARHEPEEVKDNDRSTVLNGRRSIRRRMYSKSFETKPIQWLEGEKCFYGAYGIENKELGATRTKYR